MTELFYYLSKYSADKVIFAVLALLAFVPIKRRIPEMSAKLCAALPFVLGAAAYAVWRHLNGVGGEEALNGAASAGGLASLLSAMLGNLAEKKTGDEDNALSQILAAYVPEDKLETAEAECRAAASGEKALETVIGILAFYSPSAPEEDIGIAAEAIVMLLADE